jgi:cytochrome c-type biogenesis protein CcmH
MKRAARLRPLVFLFVLVPMLAYAQMVTRDGVTLTQAQESRAEQLGDQYRCLVCQNESIEDSGADLARQLRVIIRQQIIAGDTDKQIRDFLVSRYGIFVLLKPPFERLTWLLYATPALALILGIVIAVLARRRKVTAPPPLSDEERKRLERLLTQ